MKLSPREADRIVQYVHRICDAFGYTDDVDESILKKLEHLAASHRTSPGAGGPGGSSGGDREEGVSPRPTPDPGASDGEGVGDPAAARKARAGYAEIKLEDDVDDPDVMHVQAVFEPDLDLEAHPWQSHVAALKVVRFLELLAERGSENAKITYGDGTEVALMEDQIS